MRHLAIHPIPSHPITLLSHPIPLPHLTPPIPTLVSAYNIRPNSTLAIIGGDSAPDPSAPHPTLDHRTEQTTLAIIRAELDAVRSTLAPDLHAFLATPAPAPPRQKERTRLAERLLQALLRLDALALDPAWPVARAARRGAVREVQGLLDRLDGA